MHLLYKPLAIQFDALRRLVVARFHRAPPKHLGKDAAPKTRFVNPANSSQ